MSVAETEPTASTSAVADAPIASNEERQIAIRLTTKDSAYSIPSTKFLVPANWRRFHLSELINKVLENCECSFRLYYDSSESKADLLRRFALSAAQLRPSPSTS